MTDHEKRIRERIHGDDSLYTNVRNGDLRAMLADLNEARAALTAAKAGGWVAVPVEPHGYLYDVYFEDEDGDPAGSERDNFTRSLKYAKDNGTNVRAVCILPTPPKEQS